LGEAAPPELRYVRPGRPQDGGEAESVAITRRLPPSSFLPLFLVAFVGLPLDNGHAQTEPPPRGRPPNPQDSVEPVDYRIGPGDVLRLFVWKEPDLSGEVTVRFDGKVTVPLLGDIDATARTPEQLASEISKAMKRFLVAPQVTVALVNSNSARFFVLGQVVRPGDFPLRGRTTVLQALALAGGFREFAKTDGIVIVRQAEGFSFPAGKAAETFLTVNYKKLENAKDVGEDVLLRPGDTVLVP
jgi:polysaccharide export outer membrane protein